MADASGGRVKDGFGKCLLVLDGQADDLGFLYRAVRGFLRGGNHEIADAAPLDFGGALDDGERVGGNAGLDPGGARWFLGHHGSSLDGPYCTVFYRTFQG